MTRLLLAGAVALGMMTGVAFAQSTTSETTTTITPVIVAPPVGTLSSTTIRKSVDAAGTRIESTATTYRNTDGVAQDSVTRTTTTPLPPAVTTSSQSRSTTTTTTTE